MSDFVRDNVALPDAKVDLNPTPVGQEDNYGSAADFNYIYAALSSCRSNIVAGYYTGYTPQGADPAPASMGGVGQNAYLWYSGSDFLPHFHANGVDAPFVLGTRAINTTSGQLTGGGTLNANLTLGLATAGPGAGTYGSGGGTTAIESLTLDAYGRVTAVTSGSISGYVPTSRQVIAGTGLSGGGALSADVTLNLAATAVTAGSYGFGNGGFTVNAQGQLTAASSATNLVTQAYATVENATAALTQRSSLNFDGVALVASDNVSTSTTDVSHAAFGTAGTYAFGNGSVATNASGHVTGLTAPTNLVLTSRAVNTTSGQLTGGGTLGADLTLGLAATAVTPGTYTLATVTVDGFGRVTAASSGSASDTDYYQTVEANGVSLTQRAALNVLPRLSAADDGANAVTTLDLASSGVTAGSYSFATITVDQYGRLTAASSGTVSDVDYYQTIQANGSDLTQRAKVNVLARLVAADDGTNSVTTLDLATSGVTAATYGNATVTVDSYGRITSASSGTIYYQEVRNASNVAQTQRAAVQFTSNFSLSDDVSHAQTSVDLSASGVTAGTYTVATITVDAKGRLTAASSGTAPATFSGLANTQLVFANGTSSVTSSSGLTWDGTQLLVNGLDAHASAALALGGTNATGVTLGSLSRAVGYAILDANGCFFNPKANALSGGLPISADNLDTGFTWIYANATTGVQVNAGTGASSTVAISANGATLLNAPATGNATVGYSNELSFSQSGGVTITNASITAASFSTASVTSATSLTLTTAAGAPSGSITLQTGNGSGTNASSGSVILDVGTKTGTGTTGTVTLAGTNASALALGHSGITTTITGGFTQSTGAFSATGNAASSLTTSSGALTITSAAACNWSTSAGVLQISGAGGLILKTVSGAINITGGDATSSLAAGGNVLTHAGASSSADPGAFLNLLGSSTTTPGTVTLDAGVVSGVGGGAVSIANTNAASLTLAHGSIPVTASGVWTLSGLATMSSGASISGGTITLTSNATATWSTSAGLLTVSGGGGLTLSTPNAGTASAITLTAGNSTTSGVAGAGVTFKAGNGTVGNANGGTFSIDAGTGNGTGTVGNVLLQTNVLGNVGIGGIPTVKFHTAVSTATSVTVGRFENAGAGGIGVLDIGSNTGAGNLAAALVFRDGGTERARWQAIANGGLWAYINGSGPFLTFNASGQVGIATSSQDMALSVNGNADKNVGGTSWAAFSDARLKDVLGSYDRGLAEVCQLSAVRYRYKPDHPFGEHAGAEEVGFIAQEVMKVIPEAVEMGKDGYYRLLADPIHWAFANAFKETTRRLAECEAKLARFEAAA